MSEEQATRTQALIEQLSGGHVEDSRQLFSPGRVAVIAGYDLVSEPQGQLLVSFAANLLARLYPVV